MSKEEDRQTQKSGRIDRRPRGMQDIKTVRSPRIHGLPRRDDNYYLDLYLLKKEQQRLEKEAVRVERQWRRVQERKSDVQRDMVVHEQHVLQGLGILEEPPPDRHLGSSLGESYPSDKHKERKWTSMPVEY